MTDNVNNPPHYTAGKVECIEAIEAALTPEEFRGYLKGNIIKYVWRERFKGGRESIAKAGWYQQNLMSVTSGTEQDTPTQYHPVWMPNTVADSPEAANIIQERTRLYEVLREDPPEDVINDVLRGLADMERAERALLRAKAAEEESEQPLTKDPVQLELPLE